MNQTVESLPVPDIRYLRFKGGAMYYDAACIASADASVLLPNAGRYTALPVDEGGRQAAWFVQADFGQAVLRHYRRGGWIARFTSNRYLWTGERKTRSFAEFRLLQFMYSRGLAVPRPLAAGYWRRGAGYRAALLTRRLANTRALAGVLNEGHQAAVALALFRLHEEGVWHADLNAYNILLDTDGKAWLIDFDKSEIRALTPELRRANLLRLRRSLVKVAGDAGLAWWMELERLYDQLERARGHL
jgi:3-deoxy-D-manno-octulosonic acid kinase